MAYKIKNAIVKKDNERKKLELIDPEGIFKDKEVLIAIDSDDLITIQLLVNTIIKNDFKYWKEIKNIGPSDSVKSLFIKLGYSREDISKLLEEF